MNGLITRQSSTGPVETMRRFEAEIIAGGMTVFCKVNHAELAAEAGLSLRPTHLIIFGNPKGGTTLMQAQQTIGLDLPLKALIWQDIAGTTCLSYTDPTWLTQRHLIEGEDAVSAAMSKFLARVAAAACGAATPE